MFNTLFRYTKCSYMLRVVKRGHESQWLDDAPPHSFVSHGKLVLLVQSFPTYFADVPIGVRVSLNKNGNTRRSLLNTSQKSPNIPYPVVHHTLNYTHRICFWIVAGLTTRNYLYAHTRMATGQNAGPTGVYVDSPYTLSGAGSLNLPTGTVSKNTNCNTPRNFLVPYTIQIL
jgi:hypothetical protein